MSSDPSPARSASRFHVSLGAAWRSAIAGGYGARDVYADVMAGIVVGIVALPLSMALAIATGAAPQYGLYTAMIAGVITAALGGSAVQVTGPTAAFVVLLLPVVAKFGFGGLLIATLLSGIVLIIMGVTGIGRWVQFIPYPVTVGFTAGIAVVIASLQLKDFLGLPVEGHAEDFIRQMAAMVRALPGMRWQDCGVGIGTLAVLILWPKLTRKVPAPLVAMALASAVVYALQQSGVAFDVATINSRFSYAAADGSVRPGISALPPRFEMPWNMPGAGGRPLELSLMFFEMLAPAVMAIAMLSAIESLLSAVVADGMTGRRHDPDAELTALGIANVVAPFFGGFAATGALARTATNIRYGARSPLAAMTHSLFVLLAVLVCAPLLGYMPMASLAALLLVVAWNMSEARHFAHLLKVLPRQDVAVLVTCFTLTVLFNMVVSVMVGIVLASFLFLKRMAELSEVKVVNNAHPELRQPLPPGVMLYEIDGPLFFGAAQKAMETLHIVDHDVRTVIIDMHAVPAIDSTGLVSLEASLRALHKNGIQEILIHVQPNVAAKLEKFGLCGKNGILCLADTLPAALAQVPPAAAAAGDLRPNTA